MIIKNFKSFEGQHCETTATGCLIKQLGIDLSEPMLFGLGEGLSFIFWKMKFMDIPFIGGRIKNDLITENICRNLKLELRIKETSSIKKAWKNVEDALAQNHVVGLKLDCYHLDYFTAKIHFAGHYVAMYGYDNGKALLVDTDQQGQLVETDLSNLALARNEKGPMSSRNRSYTIHKTHENFNLKNQLKIAIANNAKEYLNPPISNISYRGIVRTAKEINNWFKNSPNIKKDFQASAMMMERAGTGGALFRNLYRDFLGEATEVLKLKKIEAAYNEFKVIALLWTEVSKLFYEIGETENMNYIEQVSNKLKEIAAREKETMEKLLQVIPNYQSS